jgi:hypothetical protein
VVDSEIIFFPGYREQANRSNQQIQRFHYYPERSGRTPENARAIA